MFREIPVTGNKLRLNVTEELQGLRLDIFCSRKVSDRTRSYFTKLASSGHISVDGIAVKPSFKVRTGMRVVVELVAPPPIEARPENIAIEVVYEDRRIIIVNKPPGMVVHPAAGNYEGTLVNALLYHFGKPSGENIDLIRPGLVHRLDKDTSGLLVVAKDELALSFLQAELKERRIKRIYRALVWGDIGSDSGTIKLPVGRSERDRKKMTVYPRHGREAITHYEVEERFKLATLARLRLQTGRTHQIRVHMSYFGNPLIGDPEYGGRSTYVRRLSRDDRLRAAELLGILQRQALHAVELELPHPDDGRMINFRSELPEDMKSALKYLRRENE